MWLCVVKRAAANRLVRFSREWLSLEKWCNMLISDAYRQFAMLIVIDETHTIVDWFVII